MSASPFPVSATQCLPVPGLRPGVGVFVATAAQVGLTDGNWPEVIVFDGLPLNECDTRYNRRGERLGYVYTSPTAPVSLSLLDEGGDGPPITARNRSVAVDCRPCQSRAARHDGGRRVGAAHARRCTRARVAVCPCPLPHWHPAVQLRSRLDRHCHGPQCREAPVPLRFRRPAVGACAA
jgi:hypothetical protein